METLKLKKITLQVILKAMLLVIQIPLREKLQFLTKGHMDGIGKMKVERILQLP